MGMYGAVKVGGRAYFSDLKAGDSICLRNAMCDVGNTSMGGNGKDQWLNGNKTGKGIGDQANVLTLDNIDEGERMTNDYVFILENAGSSFISGKPMYYLRNAATGKYLQIVYTSSSNYSMTCTADKDDATSLEPAKGSDHCSWWDDEAHTGWAFETTQADDTTAVLMHQVSNADGTVTTYYFGPFWNYQRAYYGTVRDIIIWNIYYAIQDNSPEALLEELLQKATTESETYQYGTNPGDCDPDALNNFLLALDEANNMFDGGEHTDAEYKAAYDKLLAAEKAVENTFVPFTDGYYNIVSAYSPFMTTQSKDKAWRINDTGALIWEDLNEEDPAQLFKITKLADGNYRIYNVAAGKYVNGSQTAALSETILASDAVTPEQILTPLGCSGQWTISNTGCDITYYAGSNESGSGLTGNVITWGAGISSAAAWRLNKVTDETLLAKLLQSGDREAIKNTLTAGLSSATATYNKCFDHDPLVTDAKQFSSNCSSDADYSSFEHLIDGKTDYHYNFHSIWNTAMAETSTTEELWKSVLADLVANNSKNIAVGTGYHNLQVALNAPVSKFFFRYINRTGTSYIDNPTDIEIYATNDDALGASTDQADIEKWTRITELTEGFPSYVQGAEYKSPDIDLGASYKYIRFVIKATSQMNKKRARYFYVPDITGVTWNVGEFQLYNTDYAATSEYAKVAGMKDACDKLKVEMDAIQTKLDNGTGQYSDTTALYAATKAVAALYVNRDSLMNALTASLNEANTLYASVLNTSVKLVNNASQFSTNSSSADDESSFAHLIDGNTSTVYHSRWTSLMKSDTVTEEQWIKDQQEWAASTPGNIAVGIGYHNLQVKFDYPVDSLYFTYTGVPSATYHDNPNDISIYVTNDDALGASTNNEDEGDWTEITELTDGFPANTSLAKYTSPMINFGGSYKYIRLVMRNTTNAIYAKDQATIDRLFMEPELTGVTWNASEMQFYTVVDSSRLQYKYDAAFRTEADRLKQLITTAEGIKTLELYDGSQNAAIQAQIAKLRGLVVNTDTLRNLYLMYSKMATTTTVGQEIGQADGQSAIDAFRSAIDKAYATVDFQKPALQDVSNAVKAMNTAYDAFFAHIAKPKANVWYNIVSASSSLAYEDQPIHMNTGNTSTKLAFGGYSEDKSMEEDALAAWRLVPIEGQDNAYAIQLMANGQYFGPYRGDGADNAPLLSHAKTAYNLIYNGNGAFRLRQADDNGYLNSLRADADNASVINADAVADDEQGWEFRAITNSDMQLPLFKNNTIQVLVLPFATKGDAALEALNEGIKTYAVKSLTFNDEDKRLELTDKTDFEAGEPMILVIGDATATPSEDVFTLYVKSPATVTDTSAIVANGLVGTLENKSQHVNNVGYFLNNALINTGSRTLSLNALGGYIDPHAVTDAGGSADLTIDAADVINSITAPTTRDESLKKVSVYTIDGVLVRRGIKADEARTGLGKGIYIIGGKKVIIK